MRAGQDGASRVTGGRILWWWLLLLLLCVKKTNVLRTGDKRTCEKELCSLLHVKGVRSSFLIIPESDLQKDQGALWTHKPQKVLM